MRLGFQGISKSFWCFFVLVFLEAGTVEAKGLDKLDSGDSAPSPISGVQSEAKSQPITPAPGVAAEVDAAKATTAGAEQKELPPSELSKRLANKLSLFAQTGFLGVWAAKGDWNSRAQAGFGLGYVLKEPRQGSSTISVSLGYKAFESLVRLDTSSYRAIIQQYAAGGVYRYILSQRMQAVSEANLIFSTVGLSSLEDRLEKDYDSSLKSSGVSVSVGGGLDWDLQPRFKLGPFVNVGLGRFTTVELLARSTFLF